MDEIKSICIYCASSTRISPIYFEVAEKLGRLLALNQINLVNGAGSVGLMAEVSNAALKAGGTVTGIIPRFMVENGWHHQELTHLVVTESMHERKQLMADMSDGVIALPRGCGTMEELLEIITWKQLGLYLKPIVILNVDGYYNLLLEMLKNAVDQNFMRQEHQNIWQVAETAEEAIELLSKPIWNCDIRKYDTV